MTLQSIEICAAASGQALGLEQAGFEHVSLIELDAAACQTLRIIGTSGMSRKAIYTTIQRLIGKALNSLQAVCLVVPFQMRVSN